MIKNISNLGDAAIYCDFGTEVNEKINLKVISYFNYLKKLVKLKLYVIINLLYEGVIFVTPLIFLSLMFLK